MFEVKNETGKRYGRLEVLSFVGYNHQGRAVWFCKCDCGNYTKVVGRYLRSGETKSCGCLYRETKGFDQVGKGWTVCDENCYTLWRSIKKRVDHPTGMNKCYEGIDMCQEWRDSYEAFKAWCDANGYKDMRDQPFKTRLSIDRIDPKKGYCPENCRFITVSENSTRANLNRYHGNTEQSDHIS